MREIEIQQKIRLAVSSPDVRMFRNNVGMIDGVQFGLCVGSSDLIGWTSRKITPDMVGSHIAVFTALEVKTKQGRVSQAQQKFIDLVKKMGGIAGVVRSEKDALELLK